MRSAIYALAATLAASTPAASSDAVPEPAAIDGAAYEGGELTEGRSALTVKLQVLLDRAGISPGVIDGYKGGMTASALRAYEQKSGLPVDGVLDRDVWRALGGLDAGAVVQRHIITADDIDRLNPPLPEDYSELAEMEWLGHSSAAEALAERFHMDQDFLEAMNPQAGFSEGEEIVVVDPGEAVTATVVRIEVRKADQRLAAFNADGKMVANYPVAVGSQQLPSPTGQHEVTAVAIPASYTYFPDRNFKQGDNDEKLILPPGPNNPVGIAWIDLSEPTYGIHGTPEPATLFQAYSHGCVRMTNWDVRELIEMVETGSSVEFVE